MTWDFEGRSSSLKKVAILTGKHTPICRFPARTTPRRRTKRSFRKRSAEEWALGVTKVAPDGVVLVVSPQRGKIVGNSVTSNFFRSLSRRRRTQRSSAERRHHAAIQVTKLRSMSRRTISSRAVRHDSGVLIHHARIEDRQRLVLSQLFRTSSVEKEAFFFENRA